jgi:deoxyribose-phosphate aldolase
MGEASLPAELAKMIDHSLLHPTMTDRELTLGCGVAKRYRCATVCIKPYAVPLAKELLLGSGVEVCTVVGFPHGSSHAGIKVLEAERAIAEGAREIDAVVNIGKALGGDWDYVQRELLELNAACRGHGALLKVIFENDYLEPRHIVRLCELCNVADVAFVKTSSGYGFVKQPDGSYNYRGATDEHLRLMRQHAKASIQVKAAGGVRTLEDLLRVRALGVTRVGATATASIINAARLRAGMPALAEP